MLKRIAIAVLAVGLLAVGPVTPAGAVVITKTIDATFTPDTPCSLDGAWRFVITGTGGTSGIQAPDHITVAVAGGGSLTFPLTTAPVAPSYQAVYEKITDGRLTGEAQADIDDAWPPESGGQFALTAGACALTQLTMSTDATTYVVGDTIQITARLTANGPVPVQGIYIKRRCLTAAGQGDDYGALGTGADGGILHEVTAADLGVNEFSVEYRGSPVFKYALRPSIGGPVTTIVVPAAPPSDPAGTLASSHGTTSHLTTVSGGGFDPGTPVSIIVYSRPLVLATVTTDANGAFSTPVELPSSMTGQHTIVALGTLTDGGTTAARFLTLDVRLPVLADTGLSIATVLVAGAGLVAVGLILLLVTYRRRRHPTTAA